MQFREKAQHPIKDNNNNNNNTWIILDPGWSMVDQLVGSTYTSSPFLNCIDLSYLVSSLPTYKTSREFTNVPLTSASATNCRPEQHRVAERVQNAPKRCKKLPANCHAPFCQIPSELGF